MPPRKPHRQSGRFRGGPRRGEGMGDADLLCSLSRCWGHRWQARLRVKLWVGRSRWSCDPWPVSRTLGSWEAHQCGRAVCGTGNASRQDRKCLSHGTEDSPHGSAEPAPGQRGFS
ncbi:hypothetical protein NDU88_003735 [Pleurodeles waltl]|uniref:Uncharacterized protein n=1 Tax=Pleurodeles waltl TaxID=8319 RepID=A0AAV7MT27_PLEWA|nr:hypothetical protein NDU88_003735 [Pleurodeles waltl]